MESSESESVGFSSKDPQLDSEVEPSSPVPNHDNDPQPSDLNHLAQADDDALGGELQNKLDLKDGDETENKDSNFEADGGQLCDEAAAPESDKGQVCDDDDDDNNDYDGWNGGDEGCDWIEDVNGRVSESDKVDGDFDEVDGGEVENKDDISNGGAQKYPLRPDAEDCAFYLKTGTCKFGFNCKFNHPIRWKNQAVKEKEGERDEPAERSGQTECKYYLRSGGCKFGKACKFNHTRGKCLAAPILELNFLGLPIRLGEKECLYYMRTGSCKFGANCKYNHPDPTAVGGFDSSSGYDTGSSISLQGVSQSSMPLWSSTRTSNESASFVSMILSPTQGVSPHSSEWNGYQAPVYLSERGMHPPSAYVMNNPAIETNVYMHHQKLTPVEEFPERPGEPECSFFLKTGDCKFKSNCKYHHPKNRARLPPCNLSDKGLPLRPDQNVCTHYSRYGICKFGPACRFDHPINSSPTSMPELDQQFSYPNSSSVEVAGMVGGSDGASGATIQQPVL
ncbi:zinc finger CCCH domain-containing protein 43-like [Gastrolobium bilobum]|uniref:zinc finger CCCH domain-containing protein 43-like n=1 Tax=Gastrolobium bilobum TaxID=150636 RepID=UPI002AB2D8A5|nr:zinc finger CCCH domain-containing protein 43-like [Gastrolobium bilobum]